MKKYQSLISSEKYKSAYHKMKNKSVINFRVTADEKSILESSMNKEGWTNVSGYIRYKLFGLHPDKKIERMIKGGNTDDYVIILKNGVLELAEYFLYFYDRYEKDMKQLWKEEGVDLQAWTNATNRWHKEIIKKIELYLSTSRKIAAELGLDEYFELPSASMNPGWDATTAEMDAVAEQLRKERVAMGKPRDL